MSDQQPELPVLSNPSLARGSATAVERDPTAAARQYLEGAHEELLTAILHAESCGEPSIDIKSLPTHSQRLVWRLYERYYPDLAHWIQELDMAAWREQFGATLRLHAHDILRALDREFRE